VSLPTTLTITLSPAEQGSIGGWVNYFRDHPNETPTRIVLEERTWRRWAEIARQFGVAPADPLDAFRARLKVGQLCAWALCTDAERTALDALYDPLRVVQYVQFYGASGGGGLNINVRPAGGGYEFWSLQANEWVSDVGGAGDAYVAWLCGQQGRAVPAPFPQ